MDRKQVQAFATAGQSDAQLFAALVRIGQRVSDFSMQNLANATWAFAMLGQADVQLFATLVGEANRRLYNFSPQNLANTA